MNRRVFTIFKHTKILSKAVWLSISLHSIWQSVSKTSTQQ